jgi:hypothetical protein
MIDGLGIGGTISPFGACSMCMYYEHQWQTSMWRDVKGPIRGARMVDDLPMIIHVKDFDIIQQMQRACYLEGVILEIDGPPSSSTRCLECEITIQPRGGGVTVVARNKNEQSLQQNGTMQYKRYPHWHSYCPERIKTAFIQVPVHRYVANTPSNAYDLLWKPIWLFVLELRVCAYPWRYWRIFKIVDVNWLPIHPWGYKGFVRMWKIILKAINKSRDGNE